MSARVLQIYVRASSMFQGAVLWEAWAPDLLVPYHPLPHIETEVKNKKTKQHAVVAACGLCPEIGIVRAVGVDGRERESLWVGQAGRLPGIQLGMPKRIKGGEGVL